MKNSDRNPCQNAVNLCIYCGLSDVDLTDEHIVPFGLSGAEILPRSSCKGCAKITGAIVEQRVLRGALINIRSRYNLKTRNPSDRPKTFDLKIYSDDNKHTIRKIPMEDFPLVSWVMPVLGFPLLASRSIGIQKKPILKCMLSSGDANKLTRYSTSLRGVGIETKVDIRAFERMLAKIGYSYAYSQLGNGKYFEELVDFILMRRDDGDLSVGCFESIEPPTDFLYELSMHVVNCGDGVDILVARVRLFPYLGTPSYMVALGLAKSFDYKKAEGLRHPFVVKINDPINNISGYLGNFQRFEIDLDTSTLNDISCAEIAVRPDEKYFLGNKKKGRSRSARFSPL